MEETFFKDFELLIRSHYGMIYLETDEEERAESLLQQLAGHLSLPYFTWTSTKGLRRLETDGFVYGSEDLMQALAHIEQTRFPAIYHFKGIIDHFEEKLVKQRLKDVALVLANESGALVVTGQGLEFPDAIRQICTKITVPNPTPNEYKNLHSCPVKKKKSSVVG